MRTRATTVGIVLLLVGVALFAVGAFGAFSRLTITTSFTQPHPGEYVSAEIALNTSSGVAVSSPAAVGGIIPAQDVSLVNSSDMGTYAVPISTSGAGSDIYKGLVGDYYYVAFASSQPSTKIVATPLSSGALDFTPLVFLGLACIVAGIAVAVVGALRRPKPAGQQA